MFTVHLLSLLLSLLSTTFAVPAPQPTKLTQEQAEAELAAEWDAETADLASYGTLPIQTSLSPADLAEESSLLNYYATASFSAVPYETSIPASLLVDLGLDPTGTGDYYQLPKQTDPCGPVVQDGTEFDTCTVDPDGTPNTEGSPFVYFTEEPAPYGVQCLPMPVQNHPSGFSNAPTGTVPELNIKSCNITGLCEHIQTADLIKNTWSWKADGGPGCAVGIWVPAGNGVAQIPDKTRCRAGIFGTMGLYCEGGGPSSQVAAVNVKTLPANGGSGEAVNAGYASYIIAPQILY
ncbi:MAG: hypothetical protein Q9220_002210 [cf. Caloplaca sp. 1 TL-2023]